MGQRQPHHVGEREVKGRINTMSLRALGREILITLRQENSRTSLRKNTAKRIVSPASSVSKTGDIVFGDGG